MRKWSAKVGFTGRTFNDLPQPTLRSVLGDCSGGRGAGGVSDQFRTGLLDGRSLAILSKSGSLLLRPRTGLLQTFPPMRPTSHLLVRDIGNEIRVRHADLVAGRDF